MDSIDLRTLTILAGQRLCERVPESRQADIAVRYAARSPFLIERLRRLYGAQPDFPGWLLQLMDAVGALHAQRDPALLAQDADRLARPDWFASQQMLGYCTYVDRFAGDLQGVIRRIPYLRELGVTYLHLLPFLRARAGDNDGGFAVASFDEVAPHLGTVKDLAALATQLRANGISLCADLVLNHVADDHSWALAAAAGDARYQAYFHTYPDRVEPDAYEQTVRQVFPQAAPGNFTWSAAMQRWVWTTFYPYQWDLAYTNPAVFASMAEAILRLANLGVEVFRLDSTAFVWKRAGTDCTNQPEAHWILQALRSLVDIVAPGVLLKAEAIVATPELPRYFGTGEALGHECHIAYHSSLMAAAWAAMAEQSVALLEQVIVATPASATGTSWLTYVRCHDDIGWTVLRPEVQALGGQGDARLAAVSAFFDGALSSGFASGATFQSSDPSAVHGTNGMAAALVGFERAGCAEAEQLAEDRLALLYGLACSFGGMPVLYMGDELALGNDGSAAGLQDGRWLQRPPFAPLLMAQRHQLQTRAGRVFARLGHLIATRQRLPALAADQPRSLLATGQAAVLGLRRGPQLVLLFNFSDANVGIDLAQCTGRSGRWRDVLADAPANDTLLQVAPWGMRWLVPA